MAIETDDQIYVNKSCKCHVCGTVRTATFTFDFYPHRDVAPNGKHYLMCEKCMMRLAFDKKEEPKEPVKTGYEIEEFNVNNLH